MDEEPTRDLEGVEAAARRWSQSPILLFLKSFWQLVAGSVLIGGGLTAILIGWFGASGTDQVWAQMPYLISGGLLGVALVFAGAALVFAFYLARLNLVTERRLRSLEEAILEVRGGGPAPAPPAEVPDGLVVVVPAGTKFHRPGCALVAGKAGATRLTRAQASSRGLQPCGVCEPG